MIETAGKYKFGWDAEMENAWRQELQNPKAKMIFADNISAMENAKPTDDAVAFWKDGVSWPVPALTVQELGEKNRRSAAGPVGKRSLIVYWEGSHVGGGQAMVKDSVAKEKRWVILWHITPEGKTQKCCMLVSSLSEDDRVKAVAFMTELGKTFAAENTDKEIIATKKNEFMEKIKPKDAPKPSSRRPCKRPADEAAVAQEDKRPRAESATQEDKRPRAKTAGGARKRPAAAVAAVVDEEGESSDKAEASENEHEDTDDELEADDEADKELIVMPSLASFMPPDSLFDLGGF
jgi:hypothetical protein